MREMKDSGIEWIGEIPTHWFTARLKHILSEPMKYGASESGVDYDETLPRYIRITDISSDGRLKEGGKLSLSKSQAKGYILKDNTVLFARSGGTVGKSFIYRKSYGRAAFAGYLISANVNEEISTTKWLKYYTESHGYWEWVNRVFSQATIQNIGADKYSNMPIPIASLSEQHSITTFLDRKCAEIDALTADIETQIETLEQYKRSVITEAVTKGLNSDAEMMDSEIEWIGELPKHWTIIRTGYLFREEIRQPKEGDIPLSLSQKDGLIATDEMKESSLKTASYDNWKKVMVGDLVLNRFKAHLGVMFAATLSGMVSFHYGVYKKTRPLVTKFYEYLFHTDNYKVVCGTMSNGITVGLQNLSNSNFYNVQCFYPPYEEQVDSIPHAQLYPLL